LTGARCDCWPCSRRPCVDERRVEPIVFLVTSLATSGGGGLGAGHLPRWCGREQGRELRQGDGRRHGNSGVSRSSTGRAVARPAGTHRGPGLGAVLARSRSEVRVSLAVALGAGLERLEQLGNRSASYEGRRPCIPNLEAAHRPARTSGGSARLYCLKRCQVSAWLTARSFSATSEVV
jgi:hypothetical protein